MAHFKSRPHHPMTLGKIERFWSTIWQDFLVRAQFDSFEAARERIKFPGLNITTISGPIRALKASVRRTGSLSIQSELRKTIEAGIQENLAGTGVARQTAGAVLHGQGSHGRPVRRAPAPRREN